MDHPLDHQLSRLRTHKDWPAAESIFKVLRAHGHRALIAGGAVRDALWGLDPADLDVATDAKPEHVQALFEKTVAVGAHFGVVRVLIEGADIEVATFRADGEYKDGRRPESVVYAGEQEDARRRDFTINALFYDPESSVVIDYVGGVKDLSSDVLRTVGDPLVRFQEDRLRMLRAIRFASRFDLEIEDETWEAIRAEKAHIGTVSRERVRDELLKAFGHKNGFRAASLLGKSGLMALLFPDLEAFDIDRLCDPNVSRLGVGGKDTVEVLVRWLFGWMEDQPGNVEIARRMLASLKLSRNDERDVMFILDWASRMESFWSRPLGEKLRWACDLRMRLLFEIKGDSRWEELREQWRTVAPQGEAPDALLNGDDLRGLAQGPEIGDALRAAFEAQLEGRFQTKTEALTWVRGWLTIPKDGRGTSKDE